jgi:signal transduction histidine kinase
MRPGAAIRQYAKVPGHSGWRRDRYPRRRPGPPWPFFVATIQIIFFLALHPWRDVPAPVWAGFALLLAGPALLALLRRRPPLAVAAVCAVALGYLALGFPLGPVVPSLIAGVVGAVVQNARIAAWSSLAALWLGWVGLGALGVRPQGTPLQELRGLALAALLATAAELIDNRRQRVTAYRRLFEEERRRRQEEEQRRASDERLRMARELHDVLAHSLSLITVRASVALEVMESNPGEVREALLTIKQASRDGLDEVRSVLAGLRSPGGEPEAAPRRPAPGLSRLDDLVADAGAAGLTVTLTSGGTLDGVPPGVALAAYRIIQEALTNVVRHSRARSATVHLQRGEGMLVIGVADPGPARPAESASTGGSGLIGIRERASALGGTATAEPAPGGGFTVLALLPFHATGGDR